MRLASLVLLALVFATGCVSAKGAYEDGLALEQSGDYAAASRAYIRALHRDASLPNVPGRLAVAGRKAVAQYLDAAAAHGPAQAAEHYLAAEALVGEAAAVRVDLERPASFEADLDAALDRAAEGALTAAQGALDAGDYERALRFLDTGRRYRPSVQQLAAFDAVARDATLGWAEADFAAGLYRSALGRADAALSLGADPAVLDPLRADILAAGTVRLAVFPAERSRDDGERGDGARRLPRGFLRDLSDVLLDDAFAVPQPFVQTAHPADVRRLVREERRVQDRFGNPRLLSSLARDLGADLGVAIEVDGLELTTEERRRRTVEARRRGDGERGQTASPTWDRVSLRLTAEATVSWVAVDADSRRVICRDRLTERVRGDYEIAETEHDPDDLRLSRQDRALFHPDWEADEQDRVLLELHHDLAEAIARDVSRCALQRVP